jgi:hypothetical protein
VCDLETSRMGAPYIYDISRLRVKRVDQHSVMTRSSTVREMNKESDSTHTRQKIISLHNCMYCNVSFTAELCYSLNTPYRSSSKCGNSRSALFCNLTDLQCRLLIQMSLPPYSSYLFLPVNPVMPNVRYTDHAV